MKMIEFFAILCYNKGNHIGLIANSRSVAFFVAAKGARISPNGGKHGTFQKEKSGRQHRLP